MTPELTDAQLQQLPTGRLLNIHRIVRHTALSVCHICGHDCGLEHEEDRAMRRRAQVYQERIKAVLDTREHVPRKARKQPCPSRSRN